MKITLFENQQKEVRRFARFFLVGLSGTQLDFGILSGLKLVAGMPTLLANIISFSCGVVNNFTLNRNWTFSESRDRNWLPQFGKFVAINLVALSLNSLIVLALEGPMGALLHHPQHGYIPAKVVATGVVFVYNFFANRLWAFRDGLTP